MSKTISWIITIIGVLLALAAAGVLDPITQYNDWIIAIGVLVIGIGRLTKKL